MRKRAIENKSMQPAETKTDEPVRLVLDTPTPYSTGRLEVTDGEPCPSCGVRDRCHAVQLGWFCFQRGLIEDRSRWVHPTKDPLSPSEERVYARFRRSIAGAAEAEEVARRAFDAAHDAWSIAHIDQQAEFTQARDSVRFTADGRIVVPDGSPYAAAKERAAELWDERETAGAALTKARVRHAKFLRLRENALVVARATGSSDGLLGTIRDKILGG